MMMLMMPMICAKRGESKGEPAGPDGGTKGCLWAVQGSVEGCGNNVTRPQTGIRMEDTRITRRAGVQEIVVRLCAHPVLRSYRCTVPPLPLICSPHPSACLLFSTPCHKHSTATINQYSQTTKRQPIIDSPTNQSSINHQSP